MCVTCNKDCRLEDVGAAQLVPQPSEQPGKLPKYRILIMLPHVHFSTKVTRSNDCNNYNTSMSAYLWTED